MLKNITIGQYLPGESFVHKLDPRTKILISILFIACLFIINKFIGYTFVVVFLLAIILIAKVPFRFIFNGLKPIFLLIVLTAALNIFMVRGAEGTEVFSIGFLKAYPEGLSIAAFMAIRLILLIVGTSLLTLTTSPIELTDGIEKLLRPIGKEMAHELAMMMTIALRFIPTLIDETDKIIKAQKARGADFESGGIIKKAKSLVPLLVPLFISSFRRADELAMAMEARGYRGGAGRTRMKILEFSYRDLVAFIVFCILVLWCIAVRFIML
ncbi:energy-coupling factor transporter transmembrane component T family protein [Clostridium beijerinckii]|jgi:ABC-type cobalt transport system, permease component CbiQ and related transporters|uniref:Energy-coupling factor transporter transmembrane protein EcfT n=2 Tax=Clostridium beijerinckii TaxID=1520 RepID=A0AAE2RQX2_CLOBE|nr:energy-coupling factor transporter transmembrane component T [Clostridium beijerinckii]ABR32374.1 cobalt transport protein [Clostridium beijerinckii NCIMB 8052]AIU02075.1 cobalt transport protein [Clostridium beijerinckii ATCC 35702]MBF7807948.1 energy-coupling factor transporter transmembrane protein EcfT [Clostridium beijerinckii]NRT21511.1 energy-coupling factor transport system permease protein [Clostridium beijerinckii]NRT65988.1 energy-coupling factor transport system permease protein